MNVKRIDLNLLVYLNTLLKERSVSRAAEKLGITQPAMSNALRRLRDLLGDPILVRTSSGMAPTERATKMEPKGYPKPAKIGSQNRGPLFSGF